MSFITLNKNAYLNNLQLICNRIEKEKVILVMKDNAYGHGIDEISSMCFEYGIKNVAVRTTNEAKSIKERYDMVLILSETKEFVINDNYHYVVNDIKILERMPKSMNIHLKINTGMNRNGITPKLITSVINKCLEEKINICGIMSHFHSSDILNSSMNEQYKLFMKIKELIKNQFPLINPNYHIHNSAGFAREKNFTEIDFVRIGISSYGYSELDDDFSNQLKPVLSLWAEKISSRTIENDSVGYGHTCTIKEQMDISTYDIGYADGIYRRSSISKIPLKDQDTFILGRVSMDSIIVNSNEPKICIFDNVNKVAEIFDTITYDILVKLSKEIPRVII